MSQKLLLNILLFSNKVKIAFRNLSLRRGLFQNIYVGCFSFFLKRNKFLNFLVLSMILIQFQYV
jgi:hypothetical protein